MNSFLRSTPGLLRNALPPQFQNLMSLIQQVNTIKQNPSQLAELLQNQGMITTQQAQEIRGMGNNYEQIGQYLIQNGKMPSNIQSYENQVSQVQNLMK